MAESEIEALKREIARLRQIITLLLEKYEPLETDSSHRELINGKERSESSYTKSIEGNIHTEYSLLEIIEGNTRTEYSLIKFSEGKLTIVSSHPEIRDGNKLIEEKEVSDNKHLQLANYLADEIPALGRKTGRKRMAVVLLHFRNGGSGKHSTIRHITGLTESGAAKLIHYMKKKGLIRKTGFQKFILTETSEKWVSQALNRLTSAQTQTPDNR